MHAYTLTYNVLNSLRTGYIYHGLLLPQVTTLNLCMKEVFYLLRHLYFIFINWPNNVLSSMFPSFSRGSSLGSCIVFNYPLIWKLSPVFLCLLWRWQFWRLSDFPTPFFEGIFLIWQWPGMSDVFLQWGLGFAFQPKMWHWWCCGLSGPAMGRWWYVHLPIIMMVIFFTQTRHWLVSPHS